MKNEITRKDGDRFFSFYRQFADGSIKTQYILFSKAKKDRGACSMRCKPKYVLGNNGVISFFQERARLDKLPLVKNPRKELFLVQKGKVDSLLHPFTKIKLMQLDASTEYNIREKLEKLEQPTTAFALLDDHTQYDPDAVISLLKDLEEKELIRLVHIDKISSMIQNNETVDQERHNTLSNFQDYEIILSSWIIHPMPSIDSKLQCLLSIKEIDYTKTTDILGNQWTIDSTDYRQIEFDYLNTDYQLKGDLTFPPWHQSKRNRNTKDNLGSLDNVDHLFFASQPALDRSVESSLPATVVSASQPELPLKESKVKKIKKSGKGKKKVAGFR
ncbi:hypothetical protein BDB01DRAFT_5496 [Pilobolus umbonatus]|nr:hypothetical protein BDB01DRAFT_5496 [Pilobolus umbonatus]